MTDEVDSIWTVIRGEGRAARTLFSGDEKSARTHIENNFPRTHAEPGNDYGPDGPPADVTLVAPDGGEHTFHGGEWRDHSATATTDETAVE